MHGVLRTFYDAQRYQRQVGDEELFEQFRSALANAGIADRYQYELYLRQGLEQLRTFFEGARSSPAPEVIETERRFELQVGSAKLTGRVDRIDRTGPETVAIVDYKTGKPWSQDDADESLQLSLYALASREAWGKHADQLILYNLENNTPVCTTRSDGELNEAKLRVQKVADEIAAGKFGAKPGYQCSFCPYRNLCPATEKVVAAPQRSTAGRMLLQVLLARPRRVAGCQPRNASAEFEEASQESASPAFEEEAAVVRRNCSEPRCRLGDLRGRVRAMMMEMFRFLVQVDF